LKREGLRSSLALSILESLGVWHALTIPNALRYAKPRLSLYNIRKATEPTKRDWDLALQVVRKYNTHRSARTRFYSDLEREPILKHRLGLVLRSLKEK